MCCFNFCRCGCGCRWNNNWDPCAGQRSRAFQEGFREGFRNGYWAGYNDGICGRSAAFADPASGNGNGCGCGCNR